MKAFDRWYMFFTANYVVAMLAPTPTVLFFGLAGMVLGCTLAFVAA